MPKRLKRPIRDSNPRTPKSHGFTQKRGCVRMSFPGTSTAHQRAAIVDRCWCTRSSTTLSSAFPLGDALEVYVRCEDAERFVEEIRHDEPELAESLRIEERELQAGQLN